jgi:hypothetical protein
VALAIRTSANFVCGRGFGRSLDHRTAGFDPSVNGAIGAANVFRAVGHESAQLLIVGPQRLLGLVNLGLATDMALVGIFHCQGIDFAPVNRQQSYGAGIGNPRGLFVLDDVAIGLVDTDHLIAAVKAARDRNDGNDRNGQDNLDVDTKIA